MDILDDAILDNTKIVENFKSAGATKHVHNGKVGKSRQSDKSKANGLKATNGAASRNKKAKRLPWNTDVLRDRFTPQPYPVQLVDLCTSFNNLNGYTNQKRNILLFMKSDEWKNYLKIIMIKQYALNLKANKEPNGKTRQLVNLILIHPHENIWVDQEYTDI